MSLAVPACSLRRAQPSGSVRVNANRESSLYVQARGIIPPRSLLGRRSGPWPPPPSRLRVARGDGSGTRRPVGDHAPPTSRQPHPLCDARTPSSWAPLVSPRWQPSSSCCLAIHWPRRGCSRRLHIAWLSPARLGPPSRRPPDCRRLHVVRLSDCRRLHVVWLSPARLEAPCRRPPDCPPASPCGNRDFRADVPHRNRDHRAYGAVRHVHSFFPYYNVTDARKRK